MSKATAKIFQIEAILEGVTPLKDGGVSLRFHTNEVSRDEKVELMEFFQTFGWLQYSGAKIHEVPIGEVKMDAGQKSSSQRLRSTLYVLWQAKHSDEPWEQWYPKQIEKFINRIKEELPER